MFAATSVKVVHDWVDYAAAAGGLAGAVGAGAAVVALLLAKSSADAAKKTLTIMQAEAQAAKDERERRANPQLELKVRSVGTSNSGPPTTVLLDFGFFNQGSRATVDLACNVLIPEPLIVVSCDSRGLDANVGRVYSAAETMGRFEGVSVWVYDVHPSLPETGITRQRHLRLERPQPGTYALEAWLVERDIPGGRRYLTWRLNVPATGGEADVHPVAPNPDSGLSDELGGYEFMSPPSSGSELDP